MKYPNNDLWSVRQIEFLYDALKGYENKSCVYYPDKIVQTIIQDVSTYNYTGVIVFENQDRTIILEQGENFGLTEKDILKVFKEKNIKCETVGKTQVVEADMMRYREPKKVIEVISQKEESTK